MSAATSPPTEPAVDPTKPNPAAVIRLVNGAEETPHERLMRKHLPAWVVSGAFHVIILIGFIFVGMLAKDARPVSAEIITAIAPDDAKEEEQKDLTKPDIGLESNLNAAVEVERVDEVNIEAKVVPNEAVGVQSENTTPMDTPALAGVGVGVDQGFAGTEGNVMAGNTGMSGMSIAKGMAGRSGATKELNLKAGGGNSASEAAVARGLIWLAKQQKQASGHWVFDGDATTDTAAATGLALLPFLAAGETHKSGKTYRRLVEAGVNFLLKQQQQNGTFAGIAPSHQMYAHAIATIALAECYGMTGDKAKLEYPVQRAMNYIMAAQAPNGSWGYTPKNDGDTSIVGWQIQALKSGEMCKGISIDKGCLKRATKFLDSVTSDSKKANYGYRTPGGAAPGTGLSSVGLLCRYYIDGWGPLHPGMADGVRGMITRRPPTKNNFDMYYYYYATQVVHFHDGEAWHKDWNPKMRDMLVELQVGNKGDKVDGSWDPDRSMIGSSAGRLGTTSLALLTLEVYYRHLPLYKRDNGGMKELERGK